MSQLFDGEYQARCLNYVGMLHRVSGCKMRSTKRRDRILPPKSKAKA